MALPIDPVDALSELHSVAAVELRTYGDAPCMYAPPCLALPAAAEAIAKADPANAARTLCATVGDGGKASRVALESGDAQSRRWASKILVSEYSAEVLFLAAPSSVANSAGVAIEASRSKPV